MSTEASAELKSLTSKSAQLYHISQLLACLIPTIYSVLRSKLQLLNFVKTKSPWIITE